MKLKNEQVLTRNPDMVMRVIDDETILMPIYKTSEEINCIYTLNKVASQVWGLIDGKKTLTETKKILLKRFDVMPKELDKEMVKFLKDLKEVKAIN